MPNLLPLTGLYSIVVLPEGATRPVISKSAVAYMDKDGYVQVEYLPKPHTYTAIGFPADVSEEVASEMVEKIGSWYLIATETSGIACKSPIAAITAKIRSISLDPATSFIIKSQ